MGAYVLSCCSTADMTKKYFEERDIHYVCFHYFLDGVMHKDDMGETMPLKDFYTAMANGSDTKTSQVNVEEYINYFKPFLEQGLDIIHLSLSTGISGSFNSAMIACDQLSEEYPDRKIYVIDSLAASSGYGLLMDKLADLRDQGMTIDELRDWVLEHRLDVHHWVFSTDLKFYIRGGRISKTAGTVAGILGICPNINVNYEGKLIPCGKSRSKKRAVKDSYEHMVAHADNGLDYSGKCFISHSDCYDTAKELADMIEKNFTKLNGPVQIYDIGTTIGSHTGPGTVALFFWGDTRTE